MALLRSRLSLEVGLLLLTTAPDLGRGEAPLGCRPCAVHRRQLASVPSVVAGTLYAIKLEQGTIFLILYLHILFIFPLLTGTHGIWKNKPLP